MTPTPQPIIASDSEMVQAAMQFWLIGDEHIRSPFPQYIHDELQSRTLERFNTWLGQLDGQQAETEVTDEVMAAKLEEILFETALPMVKSEDERITVMFPFLPRVGDPVNAGTAAEGISGNVQHRKIVIEEEAPFLLVTVVDEGSGNSWQTKIDLPI